MPPSSAARRHHPSLFQTYYERSEHPSNTALATYLLRLIYFKRTNLCVSADVSTTAELLRVAEEVGDYICVLKTHADIINDFTDKTIRALTAISRRKKFVIFEDRKFGDIGNTVQLQYTSGPMSIVQWAPIVNAHLFPGPAIITALAQGAQKAIVQYNTSVSTSISASPAPSVSDLDVDTESATASDPADDQDFGFEDTEKQDEVLDFDDDVNEKHDKWLASRDIRDARKHSVVSVSTTISMKSETMSPQPSLRPSLSRGSTNSDEDDDDGIDGIDEESAAQHLEELGPPPFYRALLLIAEMSSKDNMLTPEYTAACARNARANRHFVMGFIAQRSLNCEPEDNFITMTPGVQLVAGGDALGQQYNTPRTVIGDAGTDIIIVGRGILSAQDRRAAAAEHRLQAWKAYEDRIRSPMRKIRRER